MRTKWVCISVIAAILISALTASASAQTSRGIGIRLLDAPADRREDPRARLYVVDHVKPGTTFSRRFEVSNGTAEVANLQLYASAADIQESGWRVPQGRVRNELVSWVQVTPSEVRLAPGERKSATVNIAVPADAASGERYAVVLAESPPPPSGAGVRIASRVGIRVYLNVGSGAEPASDFTISTLTAKRTEAGEPAIAATVTNTGGRAIDLTGSVSLADGPGGLNAGPFPVENVRTLAVGGTGDVLLRLDKSLPAGPWNARLQMQSGFTERTAQATITFPAEGEAAPVDAELVEDGGPPWLWIAVGAAVLLVLLLLVLLLLKRRGRRDDDSKGPAPVASQA